MSKKKKHKKKPSKVTTVKKRGKPKAIRKMPLYFYAKVRSALTKYLNESDIDYSDCGTKNMIARLCYARIKEDWIISNIPPKYALNNIDLIFNAVCRKDAKPEPQQFIQQFIGETYMWWDLRALYFNILCSEFFNKKNDGAFYFDYEIGHEEKWIYKDEKSDEGYITQLYNEIKHNNRTHNISPGGYFTIDEDYLRENERGGYDFKFNYNQDNTSRDRTEFGWNSPDCEEQFKERFKSITSAKYKSLKEKKAKRLKEWEEEHARHEAQPVVTPESTSDIEERYNKLFKEQQEQHKKEIEELKKAIDERDKRDEERDKKAEERERRNEERAIKAEKRNQELQKQIVEQNKLMTKLLQQMVKNNNGKKQVSKKNKTKVKPKTKRKK